MADIDFEELDKAVNSLMSKSAPQAVADGAGTDDTTPLKTLDIGGSLAPGEAPAYDKIGEAARKIGTDALVIDNEQQATAVNDLDKSADTGKAVELSSASAQNTGVSATLPESDTPLTIPPRPPSPPAVPSPNSGRFMDVVHPSSDMRTPATANAAPPPGLPPMPARQPNTPPASAPEAQPPVLPPAMPPVTPVTPAPVSETPPVAAGQADSSFESTLSATDQAEAAIIQTLDNPAPASPFIPNPQVEKRPLGNPAQAPPATPVPVTDKKHIAPLSDSVDAPSLGSEVSTLLDEEENPGKEEGDAQKVINPADIAQPVTPEEQMLQGIESREVSEASLEAKEDSGTGDASGAGAISEVESGDTEKLKGIKPLPSEKNTAKGKKLHDMYASSMHNPAATKRKSDLLKLILIIAVIVIGAFLGVGAYAVLGIGK